jgi:ribosome maturation factor RimP
MIEQRKVEQLAGDHFKGSAKFLVEVVIRANNIITVYIDGDDPVSLEECRNLNRFLEQALDRDQEDFELTVSSAGLDRPLKVLRQYRNRIGRELDIVTHSGQKVSGILLNASEEGIEVEQVIHLNKKELEKKRLVFPFGEIKTAREVITIKKSK